MIPPVFQAMLFLQVPAPKIPDFVEKYKKLKKKAGLISDTVSVHHAKAYTDAAEKHLKDTGGQIDYEKLDDPALRLKFADEIAGFYRERAQKYLKSGVKPEDEFENELLINAMYGVTRAQLRQTIGSVGKKYRMEQHLEGMKEIQEEIDKRLQNVSFGHITEKHIDDIIKYTQAEDAAKKFEFEFRKENIQLPQAINLLGQYDAEGGLYKSGLEKIGPPYFKKKKK